jgi:hypothetical protein
VFFGIEKQGLTLRLGMGGGVVSVILRNQLTFLVESPVKKAFFSTIQASISPTGLFFKLRYDWMSKEYSGSR